MKNGKRQHQNDETLQATNSGFITTTNTQSCGDKVGGQAEEREKIADEAMRCAEFTADYLYRCCDKSFQMEVSRYHSLTDTAAKLITCISIIAVAIMTAIELLQPAFDKAGIPSLLACFCLLIFVPLLGSFVTALCSQFRFRYLALAFPTDFAQSVREYDSDFPNAKEAADQYARTLEPCFESLRSRNEIIRRLIKASTICLLVTLGLIVVLSILGCALILF